MTNLTKLDRYIIKEKCGSGGMATVYRAVDPELNQEVAIKVLPTTYNERDDLPKRFKREARTLAILQHPAIVPILNFGEVDNHLYFVMPFLSGGTLKERLNEGPLPLEEATNIVGQIASALEAAHEKQIIHRDVKPHNILFDENGDAFLADFGVARLLDQDDVEQTVTLIGTPEFMSPEQVLEGDLSPQTDIYQLGVVLFQMLTGWLPFEGAVHHVMSQHLHAPLPTAVSLNPALPPETDLILQRAMAKQPADRFESAVSLHKALIELLENQTVLQPIPAAPALVENVASGGKRPFLTKISLALSTLVLVGMMGINLPQLLPNSNNGGDEPAPIAEEVEPTAVPDINELADSDQDQEATTAQPESGESVVPNETESLAEILAEDDGVTEDESDETAVPNNPPPPENDNDGQGNRGNPPRRGGGDGDGNGGNGGGNNGNGGGNGGNGNPPPPPAP